MSADMQVLLWAMGGGFAGTWMMMFYVIKQLDRRLDKMDKTIETLCMKVEDIDRRLCRIEGSLSMHGHCLFKQQHEKAE